MNFLQSIIIYFLMPIVSFLIFLIFISVIMSWLVNFNILSLRNNTVRQIYYTLEAITRPILDPIRRVLPSVGGIDFSPIVAFLILSWLNGYLLPQLAQSLA